MEKAAQRQIHCLVQKPLATSFKDARVIQECVERAGIRLMVNYFPLWDPQFAELFRRVQQGEIGEVQQMTVVNGTQGPKEMAVVMSSWAWPHPRSEILCYGPQGSLCLREGTFVRKGVSVRFNVPVEPQAIEAAPVTPERQHGIAWFVHCLQHNLEVEVPHSVGVNVTVCEVVDVARRSNSQGRAIELD